MADVCEYKYMGRCPENEPLALTKCHSCEFPQLYEAVEGRKFVCVQAYNLGHKGENLFFHIF